jgi:predicted transcriptional regulator
MANLYGSSAEKVTFNISIDLKKKVVALKDELNVSLSTIYNEAIANYIKQKELEKWQKGIELALKDKEYLENAKELGSNSEDIYEY